MTKKQNTLTTEDAELAAGRRALEAMVTNTMETAEFVHAMNHSEASEADKARALKELWDRREQRDTRTGGLKRPPLFLGMLFVMGLTALCAYVVASVSTDGRVGGPEVRFIQAALCPLNIKKTNDAIREYLRRRGATTN